MAETKNEYTDRITKMGKLRAEGINPYPPKVKRDFIVADVLKDFKKLETTGQVFHLAGRLRSLRRHGNIAFTDLEDESGRVQLVFNKKNLSLESFKRFEKLADTSDFIEAAGKAFVTNAGQQSVEEIG